MEASGLSTSARGKLFSRAIRLCHDFHIWKSCGTKYRTRANSVFRISQCGYQIVRVHSEHQNATRGMATRSRHICSRAVTFGKSNSTAWKRIVKVAAYGGDTVVVIRGDGIGEYSSIQDAIDQVPECNTNWTIIYITSGVYR